jgi:succinyl-CoA:acetate CoA-transferase
LRITLMTGASAGYDIDGVLAEAHAIRRRIPYQNDKTLRHQINAGEVMFLDLHLSEMSEQLRDGYLGPIDVAVIEAVAATEAGIVPTMSAGNSAVFAALAKQVIVEIACCADVRAGPVDRARFADAAPDYCMRPTSGISAGRLRISETR